MQIRAAIFIFPAAMFGAGILSAAMLIQSYRREHSAVEPHIASRPAGVGYPAAVVDASPPAAQPAQARTAGMVVSRSHHGDYTIEVLPEAPGIDQVHILNHGRLVLEKPLYGQFASACWNEWGWEYLAINNRERADGDRLWIVAVSAGKVIKAPGDRMTGVIRESARKVLAEEADKRWTDHRLDGITWSASRWIDRHVLQIQAQGTFNVGTGSGSSRTLQAEGLLRVGSAGPSVQSFTVLNKTGAPKEVKQAEATRSSAIHLPDAPEVPLGGRASQGDGERENEIRKRPVMPEPKPMVGERFAETRTRLLSPADIAAFHSNDVQYAINEMFARRGAVFTQKWIGKAFSHAEWYRPRPGLTFDQIEKEFTSIESANFHALAKRRRDDLKALEKRPRQAPAEKRRVPATRPDGVEDLDRY